MTSSFVSYVVAVIKLYLAKVCKFICKNVCKVLWSSSSNLGYRGVSDKMRTDVPKLSIHPFWPMFPFYTHWKHQKNKRFSGVFREHRIGTLARNGLARFINLFVILSAAICEVMSVAETYSEPCHTSKTEFLRNS